MKRIESDNPFLRGKLVPWPMEGEIRDCAVVGDPGKAVFHPVRVVTRREILARMRAAALRTIAR